jgi:nucleoside-diphosphate-sugar epimerase
MISGNHTQKLIKKVFVTGGTGFIGSHLVKRLKQDGYQCRCLVREKSHSDFIRELGVDFVYGDILDRDSLKGRLEDIDIVFHLAAMGHVSAASKEAYMKFRQVNVNGSINLLEEAHECQVKKFIHFSSTAAMGLIKTHVIDETTKCQPNTPYQKSKYESELAVLEFYKKYQLPVVIIRPSMVYGTGGKGEFLKWCRLMKKGFWPRIGKGKNLTPLVHVDDVVQATILIGQRGKSGDIYLVTSENSFELDMIRRNVMEALGIKKYYPYVPAYTAKAAAWSLESMAKIFNMTPIVTYRNINSIVTGRVFDISKAKNDTGYQPQVPLQQGIQETVNWYIKNNYL